MTTNSETQPVAQPATAPVNPEPKPTKAKAAKKKAVTKKAVTKTKVTAAEKLIDAVCAKKGVTHAEACELLGWKQCLPYLVKVCEKAGIKLRKERQDDRTVRYYGQRPKRSK
jgi:hypothetical protein